MLSKLILNAWKRCLKNLLLQLALFKFFFFFLLHSKLSCQSFNVLHMLKTASEFIFNMLDLLKYLAQLAPYSGETFPWTPPSHCSPQYVHFSDSLLIPTHSPASEYHSCLPFLYTDLFLHSLSSIPKQVHTLFPCAFKSYLYSHFSNAVRNPDKLLKFQASFFFSQMLLMSFVV